MAKLTIQSIYEDNKKDVYSYLLSLTGDKTLSEDLTSEVFIGAIMSLSSFKGASSIKTWLFSIARYKWYDYLRKRKKEVSQEELLLIYMSDGINPETVVITNTTVKRIYELLDKETDKNKDIVLMRFNGYSYYEIAQKHGISESSARVLDYRTKSRIKGVLLKEGYTNEE